MTKCRNLVILGWIHSSKCMRNKVILTSIKNLGHSPFLERTCLRIPVKNHVDRFRRVFGAVLLQQKNFTIYWGSVRASRSHGTRFSGSSAKRAFHLSCHDRKVESAHWVVFFFYKLLAESLAESTNWNAQQVYPFLLEREKALFSRWSVAGFGRMSTHCHFQSRVCWHFLVLMNRQAGKRSRSSPLLLYEKPPP